MMRDMTCYFSQDNGAKIGSILLRMDAMASMGGVIGQGRRNLISEGHFVSSVNLIPTGGQIMPNTLGLYRTSPPVRKSRKFSKSGSSGNQKFSFRDVGLLRLSRIPFFFFFAISSFQNFFFNFFCLFIWSRIAVDTKFESRDLILRELITHAWYRNV